MFSLYHYKKIAPRFTSSFYPKSDRLLDGIRRQARKERQTSTHDRPLTPLLCECHVMSMIELGELVDNGYQSARLHVALDEMAPAERQPRPATAASSR